MAYTVPAWLLPLLVLIGVCAVAGWSTFKKMIKEGFTGSSADTCKTNYTSCMDASGTMIACTNAYNKCMTEQGFKDAPVIAPTVAEPPADVIAASEEHTKYLAEVKKRNVASPSPIPPTPQELARIGGGSPPAAAAAAYVPHVEGFYAHEMPRQTEGFSIQQQVRSEKEERDW